MRIKPTTKTRQQVLDCPQALAVTEESRATKENIRGQRMLEEKKSEEKMWHRQVEDSRRKEEEHKEPARNAVQGNNSVLVAIRSDPFGKAAPLWSCRCHPVSTKACVYMVFQPCLVLAGTKNSVSTFCQPPG